MNNALFQSDTTILELLNCSKVRDNIEVDDEPPQITITEFPSVFDKLPAENA